MCGAVRVYRPLPSKFLPHVLYGGKPLLMRPGEASCCLPDRKYGQRHQQANKPNNNTVSPKVAPFGLYNVK